VKRKNIAIIPRKVELLVEVRIIPEKRASMDNNRALIYLKLEANCINEKAVSSSI
jgi:hypothetical protein